VLFDVIPTFIDIVVALVVFTIKLDWTLTVVTFFVVFAYGTFCILVIFIHLINSIQLWLAFFSHNDVRGCGAP
jgi:ABC-type transport system involved in Fe-S cluster assembly fused permease/ATPase subunit